MGNLWWGDGSHISHLYSGWERMDTRAYIEGFGKNGKCFFDHLGGGIGLKFLVVARFTMGNLQWGDGSHISHLYSWWDLMDTRAYIEGFGKNGKCFFDHLGDGIGLKFLVVAWFTMGHLLWGDGSHISYLYSGWEQMGTTTHIEEFWKNGKRFFDHLGGWSGLKFLVVARFTMGNLPWGDGSHISHLYRG